MDGCKRCGSLNLELQREEVQVSRSNDGTEYSIRRTVRCKDCGVMDWTRRVITKEIAEGIILGRLSR